MRTLFMHSVRMKAIEFFAVFLTFTLVSGCGNRLRFLGSDRIVGGADALPHEFPWQVSVDLVNMHYCGGTIWNENWIVTAGHCADYVFFVYKVLVGKHVLSRVETLEQRRFVSEVVVHPKYSEDTVDYDIALMKLSSPLTFSRHVGPVCAPQANDDFTNQTCTATGWGLTTPDGAEANILQKVDLRVWNQRECIEVYKDVNNVTERMMCAGYKAGGSGPCQGDSGGPLVCQRKDGRWALAGITSWGKVCGAANEPAVFTRVASLLEWIKSVTE
ncbi:chymotrypsin B-like [Ornithodoros turicata]|uniref:chymotrypsin B-like n=1 Tax=Ornithodoros turicata TaxID=34597 RepID=UPI00313886AE